jgi:bacteriophage N4 adsorption protein B
VVFYNEWLTAMDGLVATLLLPLTVWIIVSGLDDLFVDAFALIAALRHRRQAPPTRPELVRARPSRIAIFVPCWHESAVIAAMIERNRERIQYKAWDFFIGAYPNDAATLEIVGRLQRSWSNVHLAVCPHDGPSSKADCLNWIYQRMLAHERDHNVRFDIVVTHDAEDAIHPDALLWINWYAQWNDMVQVPVLPLPTPLTHWTHGVYCDEFSEFQIRDMPARQEMGAFVPSNGVGTGFRRNALENLAADEGNRIFEPVSLTEDYENGLRLKLRGATQVFVPVGKLRVATREFGFAVRQRTRWVTGIALQTWERYGWRGNLATKYWLWRDRKGLIGNPASLVSNALFLYGVTTLLASKALGTHWGLTNATAEFAPVLGVTFALGGYRIGYRAFAVGRWFGWRFALGVPIRVLLANLINSLVTIRALRDFAIAKLTGRPLRWVKTEHQYPVQEALRDRTPLGQVLVVNGYITATQLEEALVTQPPGRRLGEYLMDLGYLDETSLYQALSLHFHIPGAHIDPSAVRPAVARSLPARLTRDAGIVPIRAELGQLVIAVSDAPSPQLERELASVTSLQPRYCLVTPENFSQLSEALL